MKILVIDDEKHATKDYIDLLKDTEPEADIRGYTVSDEYKPLVLKQIDRLRFPILTGTTRIHVKTFGKFELFVDGIPVVSRYSKSRELFAYLVDKNGALSTTKEIMSALWDGDDRISHMSYMKNIRADMINTLRKLGVEDVLVKQYGRLGIIPDMIDCDYYKMLSGDSKAIAGYAGEYMSQYSWAEYTNGMLSNLKAELE